MRSDLDKAAAIVGELCGKELEWAVHVNTIPPYVYVAFDNELDRPLLDRISASLTAAGFTTAQWRIYKPKSGYSCSLDFIVI